MAFDFAIRSSSSLTNLALRSARPSVESPDANFDIRSMMRLSFFLR
jgi:hypothetical protein